MEGVDALGLVLDPGLDVVELGVGVLRLLVDLLGEPLQLLEPLYLIMDHLVALLKKFEYYLIRRLPFIILICNVLDGNLLS